MVKETKDVVVLLAKLAVCADKAAVDAQAGVGFVKLVCDFFPVLKALPAAIGGSDKIGEELKNISDADKAELIEAVKVEVKEIPQQNLVPVVDTVLDTMLQMWVLLSAVK